MSRIKKFIIVLILIFIICLIIFLNKDFIIRQYFIAKIQDVDYEEYILTTLYNGKLKEKSYYTEDFAILQMYDENEEKNNIVLCDYSKSMEYQYNMSEDSMKRSVQTETLRPISINNENLFEFLKGTKNKVKFKYKGIEFVNNQNCYILEFKDEEETITNIYLNKELLYTTREENYIGSDHIIYDYFLDLELEEKYLFEGIIE